MNDSQNSRIRLDQQVDQAFDRAAGHTLHDPLLLSQIRTCNTVCQFAFPIRRDDGTVVSVRSPACCGIQALR